MPSIVECVAHRSDPPRTCIQRPCRRAFGMLGLVLALALPVCGCVGGGPTRVAIVGPAPAGWWRECRRPPIRIVGFAAGERADLAAARAQLESTRQMDGGGGALDLRNLFGRTSRGLNNLVRSGGDLGQAEMASPTPPVDPATGRARRVAYEAAQAGWRRTLADACREAADAMTALDALTRREAQVRASLADAEAAVAGLRRRAGPRSDTDPAVALAEHEAAIRRARLEEVAGLAGVARGRLAQVLQTTGPR